MPAEPRATAPVNAEAEPPRSIVIHGTVRDRRGAPIAAAEVRWSHEDDALAVEILEVFRPANEFTASRSKDSRVTTTGFDGSYERPVPAERGTVTVSAAGYLCSSNLVECPTGPSVVLDIVLAEAGRISGRVTDAATGAPIGPVAVVAEDDRPRNPSTRGHGNRIDWSPESALVTVEDDGTYVVADLAPGNYHVGAQGAAAGYCSTARQEAHRVSVPAGAQVEGIDFALHRGGTIAGTVIDSEGDPVANISVRLVVESGLPGFDTPERASTRVDGIERRPEVTAKDGSFAFRGLDLEHRYRVRLRSREHAPYSSEEILFTREEPDRHLSIELVSGRRIEGSVHYRDGLAAPFAALVLAPSEGVDSEASLRARSPLDEKATADRLGNFEYAHVVPGRYSLRYGPGGHFLSDTASSLAIEVDVSSERDATGLVLTLEEDSDVALGAETVEWKISVRVIDDTGCPVAQATVIIGSRTSSWASASGGATNGEGWMMHEYLCTSAAKKTCSIVAFKKGFAARRVESVTPGESEHVIELERLASVSGRVRLPSGAAPEDFTVTARPLGERSPPPEVAGIPFSTSEPWLLGGTDGTFTIEDVPAGEVEILASVPGFPCARSARLEIPPGSTIDGVVVDVSAGGTVEGVVTEPDGTPGARAMVFLLPASEHSPVSDIAGRIEGARRVDTLRSTRSGEAGEFRLEVVHPGTYDLVAFHAEYAPSSPARVAVASEHVAVVPVLRLEPGGSGR